MNSGILGCWYFILSGNLRLPLEVGPGGNLNPIYPPLLPPPPPPQLFLLNFTRII